MVNLVNIFYLFIFKSWKLDKWVEEDVYVAIIRLRLMVRNQ